MVRFLEVLIVVYVVGSVFVPPLMHGRTRRW